MLELTKKTVEKLLQETGHALAVADFEDIEALDRLADKVARQTPEERRLLKTPFELCGIRFFPITIAKSLWYAEKCDEWHVEGVFQDALLFWLLTLPLTSEALDEYSERATADKAVKRLSRRLHCAPNEMTEVFRRCVGARDDSGKTSGDDATNYGGLIACLLREYGGTPDQWLYETPVEAIGAMIDQYVQRISAESAAASVRTAKGGKAVAPTATPKLQALRDFRLKTNEIKEKWSVANG
jgi:hypothetical protein